MTTAATDSGPLVPLADGRWTLWGDSLLRGAGFPVDGLLRFADPELAAAADRVSAGDPLPADFMEIWRERAAMIRGAVIDIARSDRFRLAVSWQNSRILDTAVGPLLRQVEAGRPRDSKYRTKERLVANYWQRYCVKNESIGFFGPMAWARISQDAARMSMRHRPGPVDRADVFLESWPVDALARVLDEEPGLRPWLCPRRLPHLQAGPDHVVLPDGAVIPVDPVSAAVLRRADGTVAAHQIARELSMARPGLGVTQVYELLETLRERRWIVWRLEVPASMRPERELRRILESIGDPPVRVRTLGLLASFERARELLQASWDDPARVKQLQETLERDFGEATGLAGTRHHGRTYGGRTLTHLECRRSVIAELGRDFVDALAPVSLVLDSVRWLCWRIRRDFEPHVRNAYRLIARPGGPPPNACMLWVKCVPLLSGKLNEITDAALLDFHQRWQSVLGYSGAGADRRLSYEMDDLREIVREKFGAPSSGWADARWCSPDIMIAAASADEVRRGRFRLVLGELHAAMNSIDYNVTVLYHPDRAGLFRCLDASFPRPRVLVCLPKERPPRLTVRAQPVLVRDEDYRLAMLPHTPLPMTGRVRFGADIPVSEEADALVAMLGPDDHVDVMDLFAEPFKDVLLRKLELFPSDRYRPRITIGQLTVAREYWSFPVGDMSFTREPDEPSRYVAARRWLRTHGLPRHVFVKSPLEMKPFFVDFSSPVYVEILAAAVRRLSREAGGAADSPRLKFTEMLPGPDEAWLPDSAGNRYTSEFRLVALDSASAGDTAVVRA